MQIYILIHSEIIVRSLLRQYLWKITIFKPKQNLVEKIDIYILQIFLMFGLTENNWILKSASAYGDIMLYTLWKNFTVYSWENEGEVKKTNHISVLSWA